MSFNFRDFISSMQTSESPFDEGTGEFISLDLESAKFNLKLTERAIENGVKIRPSITTSRKDEIAVQIDSYLNEKVSIAKNSLCNHLRAIDELNEDQSKLSIQHITKIFESAKAELKTIYRDWDSALFTARRDWATGEAELKNFRENHDRIGPASYPEDRVKHVGWIFVILMLEIILNALALGDAHPDGPIGVAVPILMFGITNIAVSFILGFFIWSGFYHITNAKRYIATILSIPLILFIIFWNFFLAHYRDAVVKLAEDSLNMEDTVSLVAKLGGKAIDGILTSPFFMDDIKSYLLLCLGLVASFVATNKSFTLDDPYPGYGQISRRQKQLAESFNEQQTSAFNEMNDLIEDYSHQINSYLAVIESNNTALNIRQKDRKQLFEKYKNWLSSIQSAGEALYAFYRDENMKARKSKEPKCFATTDFSLSENSKIEDEEVKQIPSNYSNFQKICKSYLAELNKSSRTYQGKFKDIEDISANKGLDQKFMEPVVCED